MLYSVTHIGDMLCHLMSGKLYTNHCRQSGILLTCPAARSSLGPCTSQQDELPSECMLHPSWSLQEEKNTKRDRKRNTKPCPTKAANRVLLSLHAYVGMSMCILANECYAGCTTQNVNLPTWVHRAQLARGCQSKS